MDHLFHPWHWAPLFVALPFLGIAADYARTYIKQKQRKNVHVREEADQDHRPEG